MERDIIKKDINEKDIVIIGAGPAGLAAATEARKKGAGDILVIEREPRAGGILNQCIHDGFGLINFRKALTGPEYARLYIDMARELGIDIALNTMVQDMSSDRMVTAVNRNGMKKYKAGAIILAMGCRERTRGSICIPGTRPAGVFTAGVAQNFINIKNIMVGKKIIILGSGDIGLIMARRLTLEGASVLAVVEKLPYPGGLQRNITQCLDDFGIPLMLSHTITRIEGHERVRRVTITRVDMKGSPVRDTSVKYDCDTVILSVGLIPENELSEKAGVLLDRATGGAIVDENLQTSVPGIFACGNVLQVHDLVDHVSAEGGLAAAGAVSFISCSYRAPSANVTVKAGKGIRYVLPQRISSVMDTVFSLRPDKSYTDSLIVFNNGGRIVLTKSFRRLNPAEMTRITLKSSELKGVSALEVYIDNGHGRQ